MKKINLEGLNENVIYEKLDNGLDVYVLRKKDHNSFSAYFVTNYGALTNKFIPINEKDMHEFPTGIAHFLEHKLFEQKNGINALETFSKLGGVCNAFTNYLFTTYYVEGTENFYENLNFLIDNVQSPYFTDENVEKEKGIIKQEALMNKDDPYRTFYYKTLDNLFVNLKYGMSLVGSFEDIDSITKEDLYRCYNTFYNPSNMCLIVVSNQDENDVLKFIRDNQNKKDFDKIDKVKKEKISEPECVNKKYEVFHDNVTKNNISVSIKLPFCKFNIDKITLITYLKIIFYMNFGKISEFNMNLKKKNIIDGNISIDVSKYDDYAIVSLECSGEDTDKVVELINEKMNDMKLSEEDFNLIKKSIISNFVYYLSNVGRSMSYLLSDYCNYGKVQSDTFTKYKCLNFEELNNVFNNCNFDNKSVIIMKPLEKR